MRFLHLSIAVTLLVKSWALPRSASQDHRGVNRAEPFHNIIDKRAVKLSPALSRLKRPEAGGGHDPNEPVVRKMPRKMTEEEKRRAREQAYVDREGWERYTKCLYNCLEIPEEATSFNYEAEQYNQCVTWCGKGEEFFVSEGFFRGERPLKEIQTIDVPYEVVREDESSTQPEPPPIIDIPHKQTEDQSSSLKQGVSDRLHNFAANIQRIGAAGMNGDRQSQYDGRGYAIPRLAGLPVRSFGPLVL